jgi:CelD/BcsL family acetyltransferase involved in cellulose biosynthesis
MSATGRLIEDADALEPFYGQWDELAVAARRPFCAPGWMLPWWRCVAPPGAALRVALAVDGDRLLGVAPFFAERHRAFGTRFRMLASQESFRLEPLARPGFEREVAGVFARTLAAGQPDLLVCEGIEARSPWPERLAEAWPGGRPWIHRAHSKKAVTVGLDAGGAERWLSTRDGKFRRELRRCRRKLSARGARFRLATPETLDADLDAFSTLHYGRWSDRGGSKALNPRVERMLREAAGRLLPDQRFRLWCLEVGDEMIAAWVCVAAGGEVAAWLSGFDDSWRAHAPSNQVFFKVLEDAFDRGESRVDLHIGDDVYKRRFADGEEALEWVTLVPRGPRYALIRARHGSPQLLRRIARVPRGDRRLALGRLRSGWGPPPRRDLPEVAQEGPELLRSEDSESRHAAGRAGGHAGQER